MALCRKCTSSEPQPPPNARLIRRMLPSAQYEVVTYDKENDGQDKSKDQ